MKTSRFVPLFLLTSMFAVAQPPARGNWTTFGGDPQRTGFNRGEHDLTLDNVANLKLEWSLKLDVTPRQMNGLTVPIGRASVATPRGIKDFVITAGVDNKVFVIDADKGKIYWEKTLTTEGTPQRGENWLCHNGLNATPVLGRLPAGSSNRFGQAVYALASDGRLHGFNLVSGEEVLPPTPFIPPFAKAWSLNVDSKNVIYTTTSQGCNGVPSGVWSLDLNDPNFKTSHFETGLPGAGVWGRAGAAITAEGNIIIETGDGVYDPAKNMLPDSVIELEPQTLKMLDYYTPANREWITRKDLDMGSISPVVFPFKNWELVAASGKEGVIHLLDAKSLGGADHRTPLYRSPMFTNEEVNFAGRGFWGAFGTWEDPAGTRWLYVPAYGPPTPDTKFPMAYGDTPNGSIIAFKVEEKNNKPVLTPAWNSLDMTVPAPVVIANGIVFALADGDYDVQFGEGGNLLNSQQRMAKAGHAILYALDAETGKVLFSSGDAIKGFSHFSGFAVMGGRVFVGTHDGTMYAFGLGQQE